MVTSSPGDIGRAHWMHPSPSEKIAAFGLQLWLHSQPPGALVSGMMTVLSPDNRVSFVSAAATACGSLASTLLCLGAYATTKSPGPKRRLAKTPLPAIRLSRNSTGDRLNIGLTVRRVAGTTTSMLQPTDPTNCRDRRLLRRPSHGGGTAVAFVMGVVGKYWHLVASERGTGVAQGMTTSPATGTAFVPPPDGGAIWKIHPASVFGTHVMFFASSQNIPSTYVCPATRMSGQTHLTCWPGVTGVLRMAPT